MPYVEVTSFINASPETVYPILKDMEKYPSFMPDLLKVEVMENNPPVTITQWITNVDGRKLSWIERDEFNDATMTIKYQQLSGDLKKFEGDWSLKKVDQGVEIKLTVDFEFGIPMIAGLLNPILKKKVRQNSENMLLCIKNMVEKESS